MLNGKDREIRLWNDLIKTELRARAKVSEQSLTESMRWTYVGLFLASTSCSFQSIQSECCSKNRTISRSIPKFDNKKHQVSFWEIPFALVLIDDLILEHRMNSMFWIIFGVMWIIKFQVITSGHLRPVDYLLAMRNFPSKLLRYRQIYKSKFCFLERLFVIVRTSSSSSLCRELDDELRQILDDVNEFSLADVVSSSETMFPSNTTNNSIYSDSGFVEEHLEECVIQFCTK